MSGTRDSQGKSTSEFGCLYSLPVNRMIRGGQERD